MDWFELIDSWKWGERLKGGEQKHMGEDCDKKN